MYPHNTVLPSHSKPDKEPVNYTYIIKHRLVFYMCNYLIDKTIKLWKIMERFPSYTGWNLRDDEGRLLETTKIVELKVPKVNQDKITTEAIPRRLYANAHTYHINSISVNSDDCTFLSADDLRINLWHLETTDQSFSIL